MHFVQPATAMVPDFFLFFLSARPFAQIKPSVRPVYCPGSHTLSARGLKEFIQASWGVSASMLQTPPL